MEGYTPGEQPQNPGVVKLNTNENPYPASPRVAEAIRHAISTLRLYPDPIANMLRDQAAKVYRCQRDNILAGNGSDDLLTIVVRAVVDRGDPVLIPIPTYSLYETLVTIQEGKPVTVPFRRDFSLPPDFFEVEARLVFLANPNSPSGTITPIEQITRLLKKKNCVVVVDEAYIDFADHEDFTALSLIRNHPNLIVLRTLSKSYSLAGMRIGLAFAQKEMVQGLLKVKDSYNLDRLSIVAGVAALKDTAWMKRHTEKIRRTRRFLTDHLRKLNFEVPTSQSNFVLARRPTENLQSLYLALKKRRILVRYFDSPYTEDALRISVGKYREILFLLRALRDLCPP
jgi:histidinol-phosphate aminotransferase